MMALSKAELKEGKHVSILLRFLLLVLLAIIASATSAQQADQGAQDYIDQARKNMGLRDRKECGTVDNSGAIIVCARQGDDPNRLPLPEERADLTGKRLGDIPSASSVNPKARSCGVVGPGYGCNGGSPLLPAVMNGARMLIKIIDPDADVEDAPTKIPKQYQGTGN